LGPPFTGLPKYEYRGAGTGGQGSNDPLEIYLGVNCGILNPYFLDRNIFWYTGQLIISKIIHIAATSSRCQILRLKYTKFDFGWGSAPDPAGEAYSAPQTP